jgi:hypothetical protein
MCWWVGARLCVATPLEQPSIPQNAIPSYWLLKNGLYAVHES